MNVEQKNGKNNQNAEPNRWSDVIDDMNDDNHSANLQEIDRSTKVGWLVGATLDTYDAVAKVAAENGLSKPVILGSGAMYIHAINSGNYSMSELNRSYDERRNFATTSHGVDIDFGFDSEADADRLVAIAGNGSRQIRVEASDGRAGVADIMSRPPRAGFEPVSVKVGEKEVTLRNPEAMMFGKIDLLNELPVEQIKQKWGYDVPMFMSVVESYHNDDESIDAYLSRRYLEYQKAGIKSKLQQLPGDTRLGDVISTQDVQRILPGADDVFAHQLLDYRVSDVDVDSLPANCFAEWGAAYDRAMDKYRQANILAAQQAVDNIVG